MALLLGLLLAASLEAAPAAQSDGPTQDSLEPGVIEQLSSGDEAVRAAAEQEIRRRGKGAWEPLRRFLQAPGENRSAAARLFRELLEEAAAAQLKDMPVRLQTQPGSRPDWKLSVSSDLFPFLRSYKYLDRYPRTVLLDLETGRQLATIDAKSMNALILRFIPKNPTLEQRQDVAAFFVSLTEEPYRAENVVARARRDGARFLVTVTFEKTEVWAPPTAPTIAGSRTVEYETTLRMDQRGLLEVVSRRESKVLRHSP